MSLSFEQYQVQQKKLEKEQKIILKKIEEYKKSLHHCVIKERMEARKGSDGSLRKNLICDIQTMNNEIKLLNDKLTKVGKELYYLHKKYVSETQSFFFPGKKIGDLYK